MRQTRRWYEGGGEMGRYPRHQLKLVAARQNPLKRVGALRVLLAKHFFPHPVLRACVLGEAPELTLSLGGGTPRCTDWTPSLLNGGTPAVEALPTSFSKANVFLRCSAWSPVKAIPFLYKNMYYFLSASK